MPYFIFLCVLAATCLLISYYTYRVAFLSPKKGPDGDLALPDTDQYNVFREANRERIRKLAAQEHEEVSIRSHDGLTLRGKYYHRRDGAPVAICFHGWHGSGIRDFCGGAPALMRMGCNVLLIDQRAQGASDGNAITFGIKERYDCLGWVNYVVDRCGPDTDIFLYGVSMGGATVLMAAGLGLPENVRFIVADSPFSSPVKIIQKVCRDNRIPPALALPFLRLGAALFGRFNLTETTAADEVGKTDIPILLVHGTDDRFVPHEMSAEIAAAHPRIRRELFEGAGHGLSFLVDQPRYEALIQDLISAADA